VDNPPQRCSDQEHSTKQGPHAQADGEPTPPGVLPGRNLHRAVFAP
jgi:hypothetical protein